MLTVFFLSGPGRRGVHQGSIMCPYEKLRLMLLSMHLSPLWDNKLMKCHFLPLDNAQQQWLYWQRHRQQEQRRGERAVTVLEEDVFAGR